MKRTIVIIVSIIFCITIYGQKSDSLLFTYHYDESEGMMLKWIPTSYNVMMNGFKQGYNIFRAEADEKQDGSEELKDFVKLNDKPIKYWDIEKISAEMQNDSDLIIPALFFGNEEELFIEKVNANAEEAMQDASTKDFLILWAVSAVVKSNNVADAMGFYFLDKEANKNKKYIYKLELIEHPELTNHLIVFPAKDYTVKKVMGVSHAVEYGAATLKWYNNENKEFPFYDIYRSTKPNKNFEKLNKKPYAGSFGSQVRNKNFTTYTDSFPEYNKKYYYKIIGINAFGVEGVPSDVEEVDAFYRLTQSPYITSIETLEGNDIELEWSASPADEKYITGYAVYRANSGDGDYKRVHEGLLNPKKFIFKDESKKWVSNYYKVCAYAEGGDSILSLLKYHGIIDSIPPSSPKIAIGICDTNGVVTLQWERPPEDDILGYRVFKSYMKKIEPIRLFEGTVKDTIITDTISLKEPYNQIYYRVSAVDMMANPSPPSKYIEIQIPDMNPPTNGYIQDYKVTEEGVHLKWKNSRVYDLKCMYLLRKMEKDIAYDTVLVTYADNLINTYMDTETKANVNYTYTLVAQDEAGLFSDYSNEITVTQLAKKEVLNPQNLEAFVSQQNRMIKLVWEFNHIAVGFRIYRAEDDGQLSTYTFVKGTKREYYDKNIRPNSIYKYVIVAELPDNFKSGYSNMIEVKY